MQQKNFESLRKGGRVREFLSTQYVENALGGSLKNRKRLDPFSDDLLLSLEDILELEEHGEVKSVEDGDNTTIAEIVVQRALNRLPKIEREIVIRYYFQGQICQEIAEILDKDSDFVNNSRLRAIGKLERLVVEEKQQLGITADFNLCSICNHSDVQTVNEFIHLWLDSKSWKLQGILAALSKKFSVSSMSKEDLESHIEYHMGLENDFAVLSKLQEQTEKHTVQINVSISVGMDKLLTSISNQYGVSKPYVIRQSLRSGIQWLQVMLRMNDHMFHEQLRLIQMMRRLKV